MNVASNAIITDDSALGYINAAEDLDMTPLKSFFMKRSEFITTDSKGQFRLNNLSYPVTEIIGVFFQFEDLYQQNTYLQYVDPTVFGEGYGTVYTDALYTIMTASDGTNDQILAVYPAPPSQRMGIEYYCDWAKLGDLTTNSRLQQQTLVISGAASEDGTVTVNSTILGNTVTTVIPITVNSSAQQVQNAIVASRIGFQNTAGNNTSLWTASVIAGSTNVLLTSPQYIPETATVTVTTDVSGIDIINTTTSTPFIQTVQTNWFLHQFPYLYYYAALKHAYNGLEDIERYQLVEKEFLKAVQVFQQFTDRAEWAGSNQSFNYNQSVIW